MDVTKLKGNAHFLMILTNMKHKEIIERFLFFNL